MASKHTNLILFIFLTSLPLFFFMLYYEKRLEKTLLEFIDILTPHSPIEDNSLVMFPGQHISITSFYPRSKIYWIHSITPNFLRGFISLCILHLIPLHLLTLLSAISTIHLASRLQLQTTDQENSFTLREHKDMLKGAFVTSILVLFLSSCALLGFLWLSIQSYTMTMTMSTMTTGIPDYFDPWFSFVYPIICIPILLVKFLELSAVWNMSLVVSVMEGVDGMRAFSLAFFFNRGSERRGLFMMFVFFALGLGLRIPCLFEGEDREAGFVVRTGLLWVLHLVKWVACTWYYFGCKNRVLQKKADLEVGGKVENESSQHAP